jgi:hypothetical protein
MSFASASHRFHLRLWSRSSRVLSGAIAARRFYGDRYGGEWPREQFHKRSIFYEPAEKPKSELYRDLLPLINSGAVEILDNERLIAQLVSLERRTARGGKESIDHAPGAHDDVANAVAGALVTAYKEPGISNFKWPIK